NPIRRYKMPAIVVKVEGKGNGIKTVIVNMADVAKALERPASYTAKYFGFELGAQTSIDEKKDRYVVNGEHAASRLQEILDGFIKKFVLCPSCENPETALKVKGNTIHSCKACGHSFVIDPKLRLSSFIVKKPPPSDSNYDKIVISSQKVEKVSEKNGGAIEKSNHCSSNEEVDDDEDWAEPTGQFAICQEETRLAARFAKHMHSKDLEKTKKERLDMLHEFFNKAKENSKIDGKVLLNEAERLNVKQRGALLLVPTFLDEKILAEDQLKKLEKVFLRFSYNDKKAQSYLLGGIMQLIIEHETTLLPKSVEEKEKKLQAKWPKVQTILDWAEKPTGKHEENERRIIEKSAIFIDWLKTAEEEGEEEEEDVEFEVQKENKTSEMKRMMEERARRAEAMRVLGDDGEEIGMEGI
ncbi:hypothetical protein PENTCL1PPCAC_330, partial [Pristionchus entomophagus]